MAMPFIWIILLLTQLLGCNNSNEDNATEVEAGNARYEITFNSNWTKANFPYNFPENSNPHFSGLIGATHNINVILWATDSLATPGIKEMAETGKKDTLIGEIQYQIDIGDADKIISEGGLTTPPSEIKIIVDVTPNYSLLTLVSMLAPSPDWFVGVSALNLMENGVWADSLIIDLNVYDAGSDDGADYTSPDDESLPRQIISEIDELPFKIDSEIKPVSQFIITRVDN